VLKAFGLKVGKVATGQFEARVWELIDAGDAQIRWVVGTMLATRAAVVSQLALLHQAMLAVVKQNQVCRRLMTVPGVGALIALAFRTAVDEPERFPSSAAVGAYFGLTPSKYASGETDYTAHITKCGDKAVRVLLCEAANALLTRVSRRQGPAPLRGLDGQATAQPITLTGSQRATKAMTVAGGATTALARAPSRLVIAPAPGQSRCQPDRA
jgi:transposase